MDYREREDLRKEMPWLIVFIVIWIGVAVVAGVKSVLGAEFEVIESSTTDQIDTPMQWHVEESTTSACSKDCDDVELNQEDLR